VDVLVWVQKGRDRGGGRGAARAGAMGVVSVSVTRVMASMAKFEST